MSDKELHQESPFVGHGRRPSQAVQQGSPFIGNSAGPSMSDPSGNVVPSVRGKSPVRIIVFAVLAVLLALFAYSCSRSMMDELPGIVGEASRLFDAEDGVDADASTFYEVVSVTEEKIGKERVLVLRMRYENRTSNPQWIAGYVFVEDEDGYYVTSNYDAESWLMEHEPDSELAELVDAFYDDVEPGEGIEFARLFDWEKGMRTVHVKVLNYRDDVILDEAVDIE